MSDNSTLTDASIEAATRLEFPKKGFVDEFGVSRFRRPSVTLIVKRDVVAPLLIRNTEDSRAEIQEINGQVHAQSNPEKFISKERLTGLDLLRSLDTSGSLIDDGYTYNQPDTWEQALNLDPFCYGVSGTGSEEFALKSHVTQGYVLTTDEYNFTDEETRNAVYETGTMKSYDDEHGFDQSTALYSLSPVKIGNSFVHFVTIEASLPGMVAYVLHNLLNTASYGARDTRHGKNVDNKIIGLIQSDHPVSLSTGEWLMDYYTQPTPGSESADADAGADVEANNRDSLSVVESVASYVSDAEKDHWEVYFDEVDSHQNFPEWFTDLHEVAGRTAPDAEEQLVALLSGTTQKVRTDIGE